MHNIFKLKCVPIDVESCQTRNHSLRQDIEFKTNLSNRFTQFTILPSIHCVNFIMYLFKIVHIFTNKFIYLFLKSHYFLSTNEFSAPPLFSSFENLHVFNLRGRIHRRRTWGRASPKWWYTSRPGFDFLSSPKSTLGVFPPFLRAKSSSNLQRVQKENQTN